jgi:hypothetical protein
MEENAFQVRLKEALDDNCIRVSEDCLIFVDCDKAIPLYSFSSSSLTDEGKGFAAQLRADVGEGEEKALLFQDCFRDAKTICRTVMQFCSDKATVMVARKVKNAVEDFLHEGGLPWLEY